MEINLKKRKLCGTNLYRRFLGSLLAIGLAVLALNGCGLEGHFSRVVFTTGFGRDEVFRIGRSNCTLPEFMVYLVNTQNQYENVYGEQIWSVELDGVTLEDNVKDTVLAKLAQIKTMYLMAKDRDMELDSQPGADATALLSRMHPSAFLSYVRGGNKLVHLHRRAYGQGRGLWYPGIGQPFCEGNRGGLQQCGGPACCQTVSGDENNADYSVIPGEDFPIYSRGMKFVTMSLEAFTREAAGGS